MDFRRSDAWARRLRDRNLREDHGEYVRREAVVPGAGCIGTVAVGKRVGRDGDPSAAVACVCR